MGNDGIQSPGLGGVNNPEYGQKYDNSSKWVGDSRFSKYLFFGAVDFIVEVWRETFGRRRGGRVCVATSQVHKRVGME